MIFRAGRHLTRSQTLHTPHNNALLRLFRPSRPDPTLFPPLSKTLSETLSILSVPPHASRITHHVPTMNQQPTRPVTSRRPQMPKNGNAEIVWDCRVGCPAFEFMNPPLPLRLPPARFSGCPRPSAARKGRTEVRRTRAARWVLRLRHFIIHNS